MVTSDFVAGCSTSAEETCSTSPVLSHHILPSPGLREVKKNCFSCRSHSYCELQPFGMKLWKPRSFVPKPPSYGFLTPRPRPSRLSTQMQSHPPRGGINSNKGVVGLKSNYSVIKCNKCMTNVLCLLSQPSRREPLSLSHLPGVTDFQSHRARIHTATAEEGRRHMEIL